MTSLNSAWTWLRYHRTDPSAAPLLPPEGRPSSYLSLAAGEHDEDGADAADLAREGEGDLTVVQRASIESLATHTTNQFQNGYLSHSDFSVQQKSLLPAPVLQSNSTGFNAPWCKHMKSTKRFLMQEIDGSRASAPLIAYCFMTGFVDVVTYSAIYVWCAFQTGNSLQLALSLARLFTDPHNFSLFITDHQALCSVLSFFFGAFMGRLGDKLGCKTRLWMTLGTFIQTLFTLGAAIAIWKSGQPSIADGRADPVWTNTLSFVCVGFLSASMGLQGIMGKRMNTHFTATVVLTTTYCELMTEPQLFHFYRPVISRDHKIIAIVSLFLGALSGRSLLDKFGSVGTLGVGTGVRLIITLWWLFVPAIKTLEN